MQQLELVERLLLFLELVVRPPLFSKMLVVVGSLELLTVVSVNVVELGQFVDRHILHILDGCGTSCKAHGKQIYQEVGNLEETLLVSRG